MNADRPGLPSDADVAAMTVGQRIRHYRKLRGWDQPQLMARMVLTAEGHGGTAATFDGRRSSLSKWENDRVTPNQHNRRLLAETLGVTVADLGLDQDPYFQW
ncbi:helix-turn-helix domain-containing protein [Dactylosporangium sp. CA-139066]|uniref:helix-turn-helix domain-containing protein n=1 Tax=Dactylosporangium sp. CA-139066 TaxID=3239930 RepID=UPI003D8D0ABB